MPDTQNLSPRECAVTAKTHGSAVYRAVSRGLIEAQRKGRRVFISRASFECWLERLDLKRKLRDEERQIRGQQADR